MNFYDILLGKKFSGGSGAAEESLKGLIEGTIENLVIPDGTTKIRKYAFAYSNLRLLEITEGITDIPNNMCYECLHLTEVILPSTVTSMGGYVFGNCIRLEKIIIHAVVPPTAVSGTLASMSASARIYVPKESVNDYKTANIWKSYASKIFAIPE
jgi:hypothetical protein